MEHSQYFVLMLMVFLPGEMIPLETRMNSCWRDEFSPRLETAQGNGIRARIIICFLERHEVGIKFPFDISWPINSHLDVDNTTLVKT